MKKFTAILLCMIISSSATFLAADKPGVDAQGAILMDFETGRVLWEKDSDKPFAMASTTKIMTAIVALENGNLSDIVTASKKAQNTAPTKMSLTAGETITLEALLYALMLVSANDAATAIAEHIGGSVENFCKMMTDKAADLGAKDTLFESPNGLDTENHHSTAYDMAVIARYALNNEAFVKIIRTPSITIRSSKTTYSLANRNRLLNEFSGATGIKTGYTGKAGHCFVGAAKRDGMQLISVVLASGWGSRGKEQKWVDTKEILKYGFAEFSYVDIINEGQTAAVASVLRSKSTELALEYAKSVRLPLSEEERAGLELVTEVYEGVKAPVNTGDKLGVCRVYAGGELIDEVDLCTTDAAVRHDLKTSLEKVLNTYEIIIGNDRSIELPEYIFGE